MAQADEVDIPSQEEIDQHVDSLYDQDIDISFPPGLVLGIFLILIGLGVLFFTFDGLLDLIIEYELEAPILSLVFIYIGIKLVLTYLANNEVSSMA